MANTIGTAYIQIEPTTQGISGSISKALDGEASSAGSSAGGKLSSAFGSAAKVGIGAVAGLATAALGAGSALYSTVSQTAAAGDEIDKMSQKLGVSSTFYQEWDAVLQHSGTSMDSMSATFKKLATASQDASKDQEAAFASLGLSMEQVSSMSTEELFSSVITGLQGMEEGTERTALATTLLGRGAMEMGALLNTSAEDTQGMIDTVHELGGVMDGDAVKGAAAFQDSLQDMTTAFTGLKNSAMTELMPSFTSLLDGFTSLATGSGDASNQLTLGVQGIATSISTALPSIIAGFSTLASSIATVAPDLLSALATGIIEALPTLVPTLVELVGNLVETLITLLPMLLEAGIQVLVQLADGIAQSLPTLIPTIVQVVITLVETLLENIDLLIDAAIQLMTALALGIVEALPVIMEKAPEIILKIVNALVAAAPKLITAALTIIKTLGEGLIKNLPILISKIPELIKGLIEGFKKYVESIKTIGKDIVTGIWEGISNAWQDLTANLSELAGSLVTKVKDFFKIGSPSKLMRDEVGKWIPEGMAVGIDANADSALNSIDRLAGRMNSTLQTDLANTSLNYRGASVSSSDDAVLGLLARYLPDMAGRDVNVVIEGDTSKIFNVVKKQSDIYRRSTGRSAFA